MCVRDNSISILAKIDWSLHGRYKFAINFFVRLQERYLYVVHAAFVNYFIIYTSETKISPKSLKSTEDLI